MALSIAAWILSQAVRHYRGAGDRRLEAVYAAREVAALELRLDAAAQASLSTQPREFVRGELGHDGAVYGVGVRLKGHRSMRPLTGKAAFKLSFERYEENGAFLGARRLTLNNLVEDPTLVREAIAYRFLDALGLASPRAGYAQLSVNGAPYGLYLMLESVDEDFVKRRFPGERGVLYEGEYGCDLFPEHVPEFERDVGKDPNRARLSSLARSAAGESAALFHADGPLDMPKFLRYLAASALIGDFDGYRHAHNYRIYFSPREQKWQFLPWGLDRVFQQRLGIFDSAGWLAERCFDDRACRLEYVRTLRVVVDTFESMQLLELARGLLDLTIEHAARDPRKPYDDAKMATERAELASFIRQRPTEVRQQLSCIDSAGRELDRDGDGHGCMDCNDAEASVGPHASEICDGIDNDCSGAVDDAAECACHRIEVDDSVYHMCNWPVSWAEARSLCEAKGLTLTSVRSRGVARALYKAARKLDPDKSWWIGYSDHSQEGSFRSVDGALPTFAYWDKGQPNDRGCEEDCVALREGRSGRWQDSPCRQQSPFICSAPPPGALETSGRRP